MGESLSIGIYAGKNSFSSTQDLYSIILFSLDSWNSFTQIRKEMLMGIKILILSSTEWDDSNSIGSTFSNILGNMEGIEIANIYCRSGMPRTKSCNRFFQITEKMLIKNILNSNNHSGRVVYQQDSNKNNIPDIFSEKQKSFYNFASKRNWMILYWFRDIIWFVGRWKSKEFIEFIDEYHADIIFLPIYYSNYLNKIGFFIKQHTQKPMVGYIVDDNYTLRQFSLSPFYWVNRFMKRRWIKKAVDRCEPLYVITEIQKKDYDICFRKDCKILFKGGVFLDNIPLKEKLDSPIKIVYTGNIYAGRYKSLSVIGKVLDQINQNDTKAVLHIYSHTPLSHQMEVALLNKRSIKFHGGVPFSEIKEILTNADILVHAESFQLKERLMVRQSFSTKIVDYFQAARCIFAVGWSEAASIDYLLKNDAAIVACNEKEIEEKLCNLLKHPELITEYGKKGWECGKRNHQIEKIRNSLHNDLVELIKNN